VLKADVPGLVRKSDAGAVLLDLRTEQDVRAAYRQLAGRFQARLHGVGVQPMITGGTEVMIGVADDQVFGPLVIFGLGGVATEVLADRSARLAPLTAADADALIDSIRSAPLLHGHRGTPAADLAALRDVLMRVSRLADDIPEISELDLNPVIARPDGAVAVDARIRVIPQPPRDPFLRRLRLQTAILKMEPNNYQSFGLTSLSAAWLWRRGKGAQASLTRRPGLPARSAGRGFRVAVSTYGNHERGLA
jgi:hypothetical protein